MESVFVGSNPDTIVTDLSVGVTVLTVLVSDFIDLTDVPLKMMIPEKMRNLYLDRNKNTWNVTRDKDNFLLADDLWHLTGVRTFTCFFFA